MKVRNRGVLLLICLLALFGLGKGWGQRTLIDVKIDEAAILIGEQTLLHYTVTTDQDKEVRVLIPRDTLMRGVEVLAVSLPDSSVIENNRLVIRQDILITSFDSALYLLPPLRVVDGVDTVYSNQVALKVSTIDVNVDAPEKFYDIKAVWKPPFVFADYFPILFGLVLAVFLICVIGYIVKKLRNKELILPAKKAAPALPPHVQAVKELDEIKHQKLWQQGRNKEYYTLITDTLRRYIVNRYGMNAMEMTSAEILDIIRRENGTDSVYANLKQILQLADFVKFAKMNPLPDENELSMMNAYLFVNQTKPTEVIQPDKAEEKTEGTNESKLTNE
ncbi:MAG: hypothetical protein LUG96_01805 [Tannerellaceae bacterium]|nr:hypothetical protein [Tannerellaceae bacterium]